MAAEETPGRAASFSSDIAIKGGLLFIRVVSAPGKLNGGGHHARRIKPRIDAAPCG